MEHFESSTYFDVSDRVRVHMWKTPSSSLAESCDSCHMCSDWLVPLTEECHQTLGKHSRPPIMYQGLLSLANNAAAADDDDAGMLILNPIFFPRLLHRCHGDVTAPPHPRCLPLCVSLILPRSRGVFSNPRTGVGDNVHTHSHTHTHFKHTECVSRLQCVG